MIQILTDISCGGLEGNIDSIVPQFITNAVKALQIIIPIILIVLGMVDLGKAVTSNDEKQMKEAQKTLIKRVVYAILIFFIIAIVKFVFSMLSNANSENGTSIGQCIDCFLSYDEDNASCKAKKK